MGVIFVMIVVFLGLENSSKMWSVFLLNDIGIVVCQNGACFGMLASAKLQCSGGNSKFRANLWRFEMLKSAHFSSVYWGKIIFLYRESVQV